MLSSEEKGMTRYIELERINNPGNDRWLVAVARDYAVPQNARVFLGEGLHGERVAFWIGEDGGGFGATDHDPEGYVRFSRALALESGENSDDLDHPGVDEWEFEPGKFNYDARQIKIEVHSSLF